MKKIQYYVGLSFKNKRWNVDFIQTKFAKVQKEQLKMCSDLLINFKLPIEKDLQEVVNVAIDIAIDIEETQRFQQFENINNF